MTPRLLVSTAVVAMFVIGPAYAQEDSRKAQAEALFQSGLKLHDTDHEAEALEKFEKAYAVFPAPNTLYLIAREEHLLGRGLDAVRHYREALKNPLLHSKNAQLAKQYIAELEPRLARVSVTGPSGTRIAIGGKEMRLPMGDPIDVAPGEMSLKGDQDGKAFEGTATALPGKVVVLEMKAVAAMAVAPHVSDRVVEPPPVRDERPAARGEPFWTTGHTVAVVLAGVAVGSFVAGGVLESAGSSKADEAARLRAQNPQGCAGSESSICAQIGSATSAQHTDENVGVVFLASGIVAGGVAALLLWPRPAKGSALSIGPMAGGGLRLVGRF